MKISKDTSIPIIKSDKSTMNLSISILDILCKYVIGDPSYIKIANISILNNLFNQIDPSVYNKDIEKSNRVRFIKLGIEARLKLNLTDRQLIISQIISKLGFTPDFVDFNRQFNLDELNWCNNLISELIRWSFIDKYVDQFMGICQSIKTTDFDHRGNSIHEFEHLLDQTKNEFRKADMVDNIVDIEFNLDPREFDNCIAQIHGALSKPSRRLITGMQGLNKMLGGGFESGRLYIFLGITGIGKSMTLLDIATQIKKYNTKYKLKDPTKIPTVVYLTMENTVLESASRIFSMTTDSQYSMGNYSIDEVKRKFKEEGQLTLKKDNPINLIFKYKPNRSIDTSYLYSYYDDLVDKGYEPICFIQDHLARIRSVYGSSELRIELGDITNELKAFGAIKDIPVLTDFHLNREAMKLIEGYGKRATHIDVSQKLGKSNISESVMILNNTDCAIVINKEEEDGSTYLAFNLNKMRDKTDVEYFLQPYTYGYGIKLVEDINGPAMYKTTLHGNTETPTISNVRTSSSNAMNYINQIAQRNTPSPIDASFLDNPQYNALIEEDDHYEQFPEEPVVRNKIVIDPFIYDLPKENPNDVMREKINELDNLRNLLNNPQ